MMEIVPFNETGFFSCHLSVLLQESHLFFFLQTLQVNDDEECRLLFGLCSLVIEFDQIYSNHREVPGPIFCLQTLTSRRREWNWRVSRASSSPFSACASGRM